MQTFPTPEPVDAVVEVDCGTIRLVASDREDMTVDVAPQNADRQADVDAAETTTVRFTDGHLRVTGPKQRLKLLVGRPASVVITLELPEGSRTRVKTLAGDLVARGHHGSLDMSTSAGDVEVDSSDEARLKTSAGDVSVRSCDGTLHADSKAGTVRVGTQRGPTVLKTSAGDVSVERSEADLEVRTSYGEVRVSSAVRGTALLATAYGSIRVGIPEGTAAHVDAQSSSGSVRNELTPSSERPDRPEGLNLTARTRYGDILISRAWS